MAKPGVSFIGLGAMGFGMATHLVKQSYPVTGFDISKEILDKFRAEGGETAGTPADAVRNLLYCVCMVANAQQVEAALFEGDTPAARALPEGATLLLCSTVPASYVKAVEEKLREIGRSDVYLVDCPVSGGAGRAANGTLSIMAGGSSLAIEKSKPLLQEMSDPAKLYLVKLEAGGGMGGIGMGSNMKMCHQVLAACHVLAASEAIGFASRLGLDLQATGAAVIKSDAWSWMLENRLPRILDAHHQPLASALSIITKDVGIITSQGRLLGFPTPMCSLAEQVYLQGLTRGWSRDDDSCIIRLYTEGAEHLGRVSGQVTGDDDKLQIVVKLLRGIYLCATAETLCFGARVGLDLDQLQQLCRAAAGGSTVFERESDAMIKAIRGQDTSDGWSSRGSVLLRDAVRDVQEAVDEAQRLKCPLYLGNAALNLERMAMQRLSETSDEVSQGSIITLWCPRR